MARIYGRAEQGRRACGARPAKRGTNTTVVGTIDCQGQLMVNTVRSSLKGPTFAGLLAARVLPYLRPNHVVIMDNLRTHRMPLVRFLIEGVGARLLYLPPYSPELNPIEECWSKVKTTLRTMGARTQETVESAVQAAARMVTPQDAAGWFAHSDTFLAPKGASP